MSLIENNQSTTSSTEVTPPSEAGLERAAQKIVDHLENAGLDSVRWKAFADYVDREEAAVFSYSDEERKDIRLCLIDETIRQRKNEVKGYKKEYDLLETVAKDYIEAMNEHVTKEHAYRESLRKADMGKYTAYTMNQPFFETNRYRGSVRGLVGIKEQEIDKRS
jgi:hypothetical protein